MSESLTISADTRGPWPTIPPMFAKFGNEDPAVAEKLIRDWLHKCDELHTACASTTSPFLPTRVLDVQDPTYIRLCVSGEDKQHGQYACLSHCWGGGVPICTMRSTLQSYQDNGILWSNLPLSFQHAVDMTRRLGLRYLWIDSLCIVQDDIEDWRTDGSKMSDTYSKAYITFAATSAGQSTEGFYRDRSLHRNEHYRTHNLSNTKNDGHPYNIIVCEGLPRADSSFLEGKLPLLNRAWAFQERLLSRRVVHFADDVLYWECQIVLACETNDRIGQGFTVDALMKLAKSKDQPEFPQDDRIPPETRLDVVKKWHTIIEHYSRCNLTYHNDRLPALQGVTRRVQAERCCKYYAGLWEDSLTLDLLWMTLSPSAHQSDSSHTYQAPSWSWASISSEARWIHNLDRYRTDAVILTAKTTPAGSDPLGAVIAGSIRLRARSVSGIVEYNECLHSNLLVTSRTGLLDMAWYEDRISRSGRDLDVVLILMGDNDNCATYLVLVEFKRGIYRRLGVSEHRYDSFMAEKVPNPAFEQMVPCKYQEFHIV